MQPMTDDLRTNQAPVEDLLRTRIAAAVYQHTLFRALDQCECGAAFDGFCGRSLDAWADHVADAVMEMLTRHIPPIVASAIHSYADSELAAITHHGSPEEYEMLKRLNDNAAGIAHYATTHVKWNGAKNG